MVNLYELRRSAAELLAFAVSELFPGVIFVDGRVTEFDFYYDFIAEQPIDANALHLIEEKMRATVKENRAISSLEMMRENAAMLFEQRGQPIKAQRIAEARDNIVSILQIDDFLDYCPIYQPETSVSNTGEMPVFKILKIEPATHFITGEGEIDVVRIYGVAAPDKDLLKKAVKSIQAAKKCDHRLIGEEMRLFEKLDGVSSLSQEWLQNGVSLKEAVLGYWKKGLKAIGFNFLITPTFVKESLVKASGIYDVSLDSIDETLCSIKGEEYVIPPSRRAAHSLVFSSKQRSYRELPKRFAECGLVSRSDGGGRGDEGVADEGLLWGILSNRFEDSDSAHIFCTPGQLEGELISCLQFIDKTIKIFGFEYYWVLGGQAQKFAGTPAFWKKAEESLKKAFGAAGQDFRTDSGETSFFGPFAEVRLVDSVGREWKGPRVGLDFNCPERFGLRYLGADHKTHVPVMVVCSLFGSLERFLAILIEHYAGEFPFWLAPEQVRVIPVLEENLSYAGTVCKVLEDSGYRAHVDSGDELLRSKVRSAENERVPYLLIIGEREEKQELINVRSRGKMAKEPIAKEQMTLDDFLKQLSGEELSQSISQKSKNAK